MERGATPVLASLDCIIKRIMTSSLLNLTRRKESLFSSSYFFEFICERALGARYDNVPLEILGFHVVALVTDNEFGL